MIYSEKDSGMTWIDSDLPDNLVASSDNRVPEFDSVMYTSAPVV